MDYSKKYQEKLVSAEQAAGFTGRCGFFLLLIIGIIQFLIVEVICIRIIICICIFSDRGIFL